MRVCVLQLSQLPSVRGERGFSHCPQLCHISTTSLGFDLSSMHAVIEKIMRWIEKFYECSASQKKKSDFRNNARLSSFAVLSNIQTSWTARTLTGSFIKKTGSAIPRQPIWIYTLLHGSLGVRYLSFVFPIRIVLPILVLFRSWLCSLPIIFFFFTRRWIPRGFPPYKNNVNTLKLYFRSHWLIPELQKQVITTTNFYQPARIIGGLCNVWTCFFFF